MSQFQRGDYVYCRPMKREGLYLKPDEDNTVTPEESYVLFSNDRDFPHGRRCITVQLDFIRTADLASRALVEASEDPWAGVR